MLKQNWPQFIKLKKQYFHLLNDEFPGQPGNKFVMILILTKSILFFSQ